MPEMPDYAKPTGRFFFYIWDTSDIPPVQYPDENTAIITPTFTDLHIYGCEVKPYDYEEGQMLLRAARVMGYWHSTACPEGELGTVALQELTKISAEDFSAAYQRGWLPKGEA